MDAKAIGEKIGIDWEEVSFSVDQFEKGVKVEMEEHHDDPETKVADSEDDAGKIAWAHLKEGDDYYDRLEKLEAEMKGETEGGGSVEGTPKFATFSLLLTKIESKTATADDFNRLIQEATPESARDRVRRRVNHAQDTVRSHQDEDGHCAQDITMADRVQPKRERADRTQMQHGGKSGHRHSARTQKRTMPNSLKEAVEFFQENIGKPIDEKLLADVEDYNTIRTMAVKLMSKPGINRDWLSNFCHFCEEVIGERFTGEVTPGWNMHGSWVSGVNQDGYIIGSNQCWDINLPTDAVEIGEGIWYAPAGNTDLIWSLERPPERVNLPNRGTDV